MTIVKDFNQTNYTKDQKIDFIFTYLFSESQNLEEQDFWNKLSQNDIEKIDKINNEETFDFNLLKNQILGK